VVDGLQITALPTDFILFDHLHCHTICCMQPKDTLAPPQATGPLLLLPAPVSGTPPPPILSPPIATFPFSLRIDHI